MLKDAEALRNDKVHGTHNCDSCAFLLGNHAERWYHVSNVENVGPGIEDDPRTSPKKELQKRSYSAFCTVVVSSAISTAPGFYYEWLLFSGVLEK